MKWRPVAINLRLTISFDSANDAHDILINEPTTYSAEKANYVDVLL